MRARVAAPQLYTHWAAATGVRRLQAVPRHRAPAWQAAASRAPRPNDSRTPQRLGVRRLQHQGADLVSGSHREPICPQPPRSRGPAALPLPARNCDPYCLLLRAGRRLLGHQCRRPRSPRPPADPARREKGSARRGPASASWHDYAGNRANRAFFSARASSAPPAAPSPAAAAGSGGTAWR